MLLLSWEPPGAIDPAKARSSVLNGLVAGTGFGFFFVALSRTSADAGLWPVFAARLSSFSVVLVYALVTGSRISIARGGRSLTLLAGLADMGANILFLLASRSGLLSLVAMISSLFPAPTVILARIFMKESIPPARAAGLGLALGGIALISLH
jgi:drug/metabolite transporter (DMT)-like permease